jgi:hypothetical protein
MYIDLTFLFLLYAFATIALAVSVYALWTLQEVLELLRKPITQKQTKKPIVPTQTKAKGHWD